MLAEFPMQYPLGFPEYFFKNGLFTALKFVVLVPLYQNAFNGIIIIEWINPAWSEP